MCKYCSVGRIYHCDSALKKSSHHSDRASVRPLPFSSVCSVILMPCKMGNINRVWSGGTEVAF